MQQNNKDAQLISDNENVSSGLKGKQDQTLVRKNTSPKGSLPRFTK